MSLGGRMRRRGGGVEEGGVRVIGHEAGGGDRGDEGKKKKNVDRK